ncbi:MAG: CPBP family glutamic-type intramembrane protease [Crocosphaera sp.]|nr:CPBP family glutamic-type intramembrane protease [Crocosphaera sp.]
MSELNHYFRQEKVKKWLLIGLLLFFCLGIFSQCSLQAQNNSNYAISIQAPFNQPEFYPLNQSIDSELYQPVGEWTGRLILPTQQELVAKKAQWGEKDWVKIELHNTPSTYHKLRGKIVPLTWQGTPQVQYVEKVTTDIQFNETAIKAQQQGDVVPSRLNGRKQVGPLQSLAGARQYDDLTVKLTGNIHINPVVNDEVFTEKEKQPLIQIEREPIQITGRYYGLVKIEGKVERANKTPPLTTKFKKPPENCPGKKPCPGEYYQVRHYNRVSKRFDGPIEIVRIPQQPPGSNGRFVSTPRYLETVETGKEGWYIYGAKDKEGIFTVQSLKPRALMQLKPEKVELNLQSGQRYISRKNWQNTPQKKGSFQSVLIAPDAQSMEQAINKWKEGDYGLVIHTFGGIGGDNGEKISGGTVTGHFSYGFAQVIKDFFTSELQFDIIYYQVYAQNPQGIISGKIDWSAYAGDLQKGWVASRPFSDVIIKLDSLSDFTVTNQTLSFGRQLLEEAQIMTARYRTGDGTGVSSVTPSTSCVQDSSQALYIAMEKLKQQVVSSPQLINWLKEHPSQVETQKFEKLKKLVQDLNKILVPYGVVRADWQQNAEVLAGVAGGERLTRGQTFLDGLRSWRTMLPRRAHDELSSIFLHNNASLWFLRTNQILGWDSTIFPLAPTLLFGQIPFFSTGLARLIDAITYPLSSEDWYFSLGLLLSYGIIVVPIGLKTGFLTWQLVDISPKKCGQILSLLLMPALIEELVFRVLLLPHPFEGVNGIEWFFWVAFSLILFIIYHPINALLFYPQGKNLFRQPIFLIFAGLLGIVCAISYQITASLWPPVIIHWLIVVIWLFILGGQQKLTI